MSSQKISSNIIHKGKKLIDKSDLIRRINIISGQVSGVKRMIESDESWDRILIQISAVNNSLKSIGNAMSEKYISDIAKNNISDEEYKNLMTSVNLIEKFNS